MSSCRQRNIHTFSYLIVVLFGTTNVLGKTTEQFVHKTGENFTTWVQLIRELKSITTTQGKICCFSSKDMGLTEVSADAAD